MHFPSKYILFITVASNSYSGPLFAATADLKLLFYSPEHQNNSRFVAALFSVVTFPVKTAFHFKMGYLVALPLYCQTRVRHVG